MSTATRASDLLDNSASKSHVAKNCKSVSQPADDRDVTHPISPLAFELNSVPGTYAYEWFDPAAYSVVEAREADPENRTRG